MPDTVPGGTTSTAVAPIGQSIYGAIDTNGDHDWYRVDLVAGQTYEFRLHGVGTGQLVDPTLVLRNSAGTLVQQNDDAGAAQWGNSNAADSFIQWTATSSGTFFLDVGAFNNAGTGDFLLTAALDNPAGMVFTTDEIAWQLTNNFNESPNFGGRDRAYAFNVGADGALSVNITGLTAQGQFMARNALQAWTDVTGIRFTETGGAAEITFDDNEAGVNAFANTAVAGGFIRSANVQITTGWLTRFGTGFQSYSYETYIHEIGHALGLGHGGNYNGSAAYGRDNYYLNDSVAYSIMSYMGANGDEFAGPNTFVPADFRYMLTPAISDIIAIQNLYGDNRATRTGNNTYGFNSNTGNAGLDAAVGMGADMFMTVYDDGGTDTLDFSGTNVAQTINLNAESFSNVLGGQMNLSIARGVVVENAFGGSGTDTLIGNGADNIFRGGLGNDTINGGAGTDSAIFSGNFASYTVTDLGNGNARVVGADGTDTLNSIERLVFNDRTVTFPLPSTRAPHDFNGDGTSDLLFRRADGTLLELTVRNNTVVGSANLGNIGSEFASVGLGDFNGDGTTDMLFRRADGTLLDLLVRNNQVVGSATLGNIGPEWVNAGLGDFNRDGTTDMLFRRADGTLLELTVRNNTVVGSANLGNIGPEWRSADVGDFNGDATTDMLFRSADGTLLELNLTNNQVTNAATLGNIGTEWPLFT